MSVKGVQVFNDLDLELKSWCKGNSGIEADGFGSEVEKCV